MATPLFVAHGWGDPAGGEPWRAALATTAWPGPTAAPDLPGHGGAPAPTGGFHEPSDLALAIARHLAELRWDALPVVIAVGTTALGGEVVAAGSRAAGLVVVDGLGDAYPADADEAMAREYAWVQAVAADPLAVRPAPAEGPDPRIRHGLTPRAHREFASAMRAAITVPVLVVETSASVTPADEVQPRAASFGGPLEVVSDDGLREAVLAAALSWWSAARPRR